MAGTRKTWPLAASARAARDARVAAIRYMRTSSVERAWHATILARVHESRTAGAGSPEVARALFFSSMGYAPPYPDTWSHASAVILADEARYLSQADLYVLTPQMLAVVAAAAQTLSYGDLSLLREDDLPGPTGLLVLPQPLRLRLPTGNIEEARAYTWRLPWRLPLPAGRGFAGTELPTVRMSSYVSARRTNADGGRRAGSASPCPRFCWTLPGRCRCTRPLRRSSTTSSGWKQSCTGSTAGTGKRSSGPGPHPVKQPGNMPSAAPSTRIRMARSDPGSSTRSGACANRGSPRSRRPKPGTPPARPQPRPGCPPMCGSSPCDAPHHLPPPPRSRVRPSGTTAGSYGGHLSQPVVPQPRPAQGPLPRPLRERPRRQAASQRRRRQRTGEIGRPRRSERCAGAAARPGASHGRDEINRKQNRGRPPRPPAPARGGFARPRR
jgi:hypothetical protein